MTSTPAGDWWTRTNGGTWSKITTNVAAFVMTTSTTLAQRFTFDILDVAVLTNGSIGPPSAPAITFNVCEGPATVLQATPQIRNESLQDPPLHSDMLESDDPPLGLPLAMPGANRDGFGTVLLERSYEQGGPANLVSLYGPGLFLDTSGKLGSRTFIGKNRGLGIVPAISSYHYGAFYFAYDFGRSRTLSLTRHLYEDTATPPNVAVIRGDGRRNTYRYFQFNSSVTYYTPASALRNTLIKSGSWFQEVTPSGTYFLYNVGGSLAGKPQLILDRYSNTIYYNYDANNKLQKVTGLSGAQGLVPYLGYDANGRCNVLVLQDNTTAANNRTTYFTYDASGNLIEITGPELCTAYFSYDSSFNLLSAKDSENNVWKPYYDYNGTGLRATEIVDALGQKAYYVYDTQNAITTWNDRAAKATYFQFNATGSPLTVWNPGTPADYYLYEVANDTTQSGFLVGAQNRLFNQWYYRYDALGNRIAATDPLGAKSYFEYDPSLFVLRAYTDPNLNRTYMAYDSSRNMTFRIDPVQNTTYWQYQTNGLCFFKQDRRGGFTYYVFDGAANLTAMKDPLAFTTYYNYNSAGDRIDMIDPLNRTWYWNYDKRSRVTSSLDPLFDQSQFAYDAACNLIAQVDPRSNATYHVYDANYNRSQTTDAIGAATYFTYDQEDRLASRKDARLNKTSWTYDTLGRRQNQADPFSSVRYWAYDAAHENNMVLDENLNAVYYDYDLNGRLAHQKDAFLNQAYFGYDLKGNRVLTIDKRGFSTYFSYDKRDLSQNVTNAIGALTYSAYDAELNRVMTIDPLSNPAYWNYDLRSLVTNTRDAYGSYAYMQYDAASQLTTQLALPQNNTSVLAPTYYDYDLAGRQQHTKDAYLNQTYAAYDASGNLVLTLNQRQATNGFVFQYFNYDPINRQFEVRDLGELRRYYYYDLVGNRTQVDEEQGFGRQPWGTSPYGGERVSTYMSYDALNRQSTALSAMSLYSQTISFTYTGYDKASNRIFMQVDNPQGGSDRRTSYWSYDRLNRVVTQQDPAAAGGVPVGITYSGYDANSNVVLRQDQEGRFAYFTLDAINRTQYQSDVFGDSTYIVYDPRNSLTRQVDPVGRTTYTDYDPLKRMIRKSNALGQVTYFGFDQRSERVLTQNPRGFYTYVTYDLLGRMATRTDALGGARYWGYDEVGNQVLFADERNNWTYTAYDQANRTRMLMDPVLNQFYYGWDAAGSMRQYLDPVGNLSFFGYYGYDASRRQTTKMFTADAWEYFRYDSVGNLTLVSDESGTTTNAYDDLNRITKKVTAAGTVYYQYDRTGLKSNLTDTDITQSYFGYDAAGRLAFINLLDSPARSAYYAYDASGLMLRKVLPGNNVMAYYTYDNAGRVSALSNQPGSAPTTVITYFAYVHDQNGRIVNIVRENGRYNYYTFDALDRLTREQQFNSGNTEIYGFQYQYDPTSNRYFKYDEVNKKASYYTFDARNYLTREVQQ